MAEYSPNEILNALLRKLGIALKDAVKMEVSKDQTELLKEWLPERSLDAYVNGLDPVGNHNEHVVFKSADNTKVIKITKEGYYGHSALRGPYRGNLLEYLFRLVCHNRHFGGGICLLGCTDKRQVVISQPWINRQADATDAEIAYYMRTHAFLPTRARVEGYGGQWYTNTNEEPVLLVADANPPNIWLDTNNKIIPIDIVIGIAD